MQTVRVRGADPVRLTNLELRLLQLLLTNDGRPQTVDKLTAHVWGHRGLGDRQLLKQLVHRLRQKIERDPAAPVHLQTLSGVGYLFKAEEDAPAP
jgi:DNA-binding response OmpR family regulator